MPLNKETNQPTNQNQIILFEGVLTLYREYSQPTVRPAEKGYDWFKDFKCTG